MYQIFISYWPFVPEVVFNASFALGFVCGISLTVFYYQKIARRTLVTESERKNNISQTCIALDNAQKNIREGTWNHPDSTIDHILIHLHNMTWKRGRIIRAVELADKSYKNNPDKALEHIHHAKSIFRTI